MSFLNKLEEIRNKPEAVRYRILLSSVGVLMFVIIVLWLNFSVFSRKENLDGREEGPDPLSVISGTFKSGLEEIKGSIFKKEVYESK